jgi:hypothetical protein
LLIKYSINSIFKCRCVKEVNFEFSELVATWLNPRGEPSEAW